jgi:hypothetical protein
VRWHHRYKQRNIEETERAKREYTAKRKSRTPASHATGDTGALPRQFGSGSGGSQYGNKRRRRDEESATDEMVYERFKKRYRW